MLLLLGVPADGLISIHALCEEGDPSFQSQRRSSDSISIHALCEEGDLLHECRVK